MGVAATTVVVVVGATVAGARLPGRGVVPLGAGRGAAAAVGGAGPVEAGGGVAVLSAVVAVVAATGVRSAGSSGATSFNASVEEATTATAAGPIRYQSTLRHRSFRGAPRLISIDPAWIDVPLTSPSTPFSVD